MTFQRIAGVLRQHPTKLLITGEDRFLGYSLLLGARAALIGMGAALPDLQADLLRARAAEDWARFVVSFRSLRPIRPDHFHRSDGGLHPADAVGRGRRRCPAAGGLRRSLGSLPCQTASARQSSVWSGMRARLERDFERFKRELPSDIAGYIRDAYRIDLTARYLGRTLPHPIGKGSGQLSLSLEQLETDRAAGLAFVVLKTVIAEDPAGERSMGAWAVHETRMKVERRRSPAGGRDGP